MLRRSTNAQGWTHFKGDVVAHVESSHGVRLSGGSTGGVVEAYGDDTNVTLTVRGQGTGQINVGNDSQAVRVGNSSGTGIKGVYTQASTYSHAAIGVDRFVELTFASTTVNADQGDLLVATSFEPAAESSVVSIHGVRMSTAATSRVTVILGAQQSTATSTGSGTIRFSWLDLT